MGCREVWQGVPTWRLRSVMRHLRVEPGRTLLRIVCIRNTDVETARCTATPYTGSWNRKPAAAVQVRCVATPSAISAAPSAPSASCPSPGLARAIERDSRRSEEHTSELQSLMRLSYAVFCLKTKQQSL